MRHNLSHYIVTVLVQLVIGGLKLIALIPLGYAGWLLWRADVTPYNLVLGLPVLLVTAGLAINFLWSFILSIFSPVYNRGICPLCRRQVEE